VPENFAFAHDRASTRTCVLKNRLTYEIIDARTIA